jgi:hypothetical protein
MKEILTKSQKTLKTNKIEKGGTGLTAPPP